MAKDNCIMCGKETPYDYETHIDFRVGYIEGAGQLCYNCYKKDGIGGEEIFYKTTNICIPSSLVSDTPNDSELGEKVRNLYWESQNK